MAYRNIIEIDRAKCNGCGLCTKACAEGALEIDSEGKAVLVREIYCDGLGACLNVCSVDALKIVKKECPNFDEKATHDHVLKARGAKKADTMHFSQAAHGSGGGCPGSMAREIQREDKRRSPQEGVAVPPASELSQWPIQLHLVSPQAPYFNECDLLVAADCTAFALGSFHGDLLKKKKLVIGCPKLDETDGSVEKLAEILKRDAIYSLTVAIMEVPCCAGLYQMAEKAVELSGTKIRIKKIIVGIDGHTNS